MTASLQMSSPFKHHEPCPQCGSKNNLARYEDGSAYCFGSDCKYYEKNEGQATVIKIKSNNNFQDGEFQDLLKRKISSETCRKYNYQCNQKYQIANYYNKNKELVAQKLRTPNKEFKWIGESKDILLFGQQVFRDGDRRLVITEGEIDALTISQYVFSNKYAAVSIPMGVQSAKKHVLNNIEWVEKFEEVIICFDNDEPGRKAAQEVASIITPGKAKIASLSGKDANEMVQEGRGKELISAVYDASIYRPDGIIHGADTWDIFIKDDEFETSQYPYSGLNEYTNGIRSSEIVTITAGSGIGKSQLCREIAYNLIKQGKTIGYIALEENVRRSITGFLSIDLNKQLHKPEIKALVPEEELKASYQRVSKQVYFYDHWGSTDTENLLAKLKYLNQACGCTHIFLDHLSIMVSGIHEGDERRIIDNMMTKLRSLTQQLNLSIIAVCHLKRLEGNRDHVDGVRTSLGHLRGSAAIAQLSDMVIGCERNQQSEDNPHLMTIRVLKNRFTGQTGVACQLQFNQETGRLYELGNMQSQDATERRESYY